MQTYKLFAGDDMLLIDQAGAQTELMMLPPAQPEPKRGKWESQSGGGYCCSECGQYAMDKADGRIVMISIKSKFCPYCGADMREVAT